MKPISKNTLRAHRGGGGRPVRPFQACAQSVQVCESVISATSSGRAATKGESDGRACVHHSNSFERAMLAVPAAAQPSGPPLRLDAPRMAPPGVQQGLPRVMAGARTLAPPAEGGGGDTQFKRSNTTDASSLLRCSTSRPRAGGFPPSRVARTHSGVSTKQLSTPRRGRKSRGGGARPGARRARNAKGEESRARIRARTLSHFAPPPRPGPPRPPLRRPRGGGEQSDGLHSLL